MLYALVRIIIWGCVFAVAYYQIIKKSKIIKKRRVAILSFVLCLLLCSLTGYLPVENLFISFKTPESVLWYFNDSKVDDVVHGNDSSMVILSNKRNSSTGHLIVPRSPKGYKIPSIHSTRRILRKSSYIARFDVYSVIGTDDYYIIGHLFSEEDEVTISDTNGTVRYIADRIGDIYSVRFFGYIESFTYDYYLLINGEKVDMHG